MTDTAVLPPDLAMPPDGPPLASWVRRVVAALLDGSILAGASWVVLGSGGSSPTLTPTFAPGAAPEPGWSTSPWLVALLVAMLALQGWTGATPGKRVAGVAVVRLSDGRPVGFVASVLRVVAHLLDAIFFVGYLRPLWHPRKQTFADSIVGTLAVQTREPLPHPWFARFRREPSAVGSTAVTVAALAACVLGVGFSSSTSVWGGDWEAPVPCTADGTVAAPSAAGNASRSGGAMSERRLWITRTVDADVDKALSVRWTWTATDRHLDGVRYETDVRRADGSTIWESQDLESTGRASEILRADVAFVPAGDLREAGPVWTAQTRLVVDGETVGACTIDSADWDAANRG